MRYLLAFPLMALAACATPLEQCVDGAARQYANLQEAARIAEGNIARGYAIDRRVVPVNRVRFCTGTSFGNRVRGGLSTCSQTDYRTIETPVPIDLAAEQRKLASTRERLSVAREQRDQQIGACYQRFQG
ncbi:MAG: hypothetical protein AAFV27_07005 [Pseudomonadota bacterium]